MTIISAVWVLTFMVTGWEGQGDGYDIEAFTDQRTCEQARLILNDGVRGGKFGPQGHEGEYWCTYEPEWQYPKPTEKEHA